MAEYQEKVSGSWNQRMQLIRLRRKKESFHLWQEFKIIPRWLVWTVFVLFLIAQVIAFLINFYNVGQGSFPPELNGHPALQSLALAGIITAVSLFLAMYIFLVAYVNRDAKRRGMNSSLWTLLVVVLSPAYFAVGFIVYFLMREPLPYNCPQCGSLVGPRFNFCPTCKCNLHPACPQCSHEVSEGDKYCPYCAHELTAPVVSPPVAGNSSGPGADRK
jgi:amino acid transporter